MVNRKGLSYSLEVILSALILISFTYGIFQIPQGNDWNQYRSEIEAEDLTQTLHKSGISTSLVSRGETGSLQTAITTVSDSGREISGSITNIPIGEVQVGYHAVGNDQHTVDLEEVESGDDCSGDLDDDIDTEQPILRTQNLGAGGDNYDVRLYIADTESQFDDSVDYNTVWVDNGTTCQFEADEGPYYLEDNFKWGDENKTGHPEDFFQVKDINSNDMTLYQSTIPMKLHKQMSQPVNSLRPEVEVDVIDITDEEMSQDVFVFRKDDALNTIDSNQATVEDYMSENPVVMMMNISETEFDNSNFLQQSGFQWVDAGFEIGYEGGPTDIDFTDSDRSRNIETFFEGMRGESSNAQLSPAGPIVSNTSNTLTESNPAVQGGNQLNTDAWSDRVDSMATTSYSGDPQPYCTSERYEGTLNLPDNNYDILNTEVVGSSGSCPTNAWAVNVGFQDASDTGRGPYLQGEQTVIDRRNYTVITNSGQPGCDLGECVFFRFAGNSNVEVVNFRENFQGFDGQRLALTGRESSYSEDDIKLLSSLIFSMYDSEVTFEGRDDPTSISTNIVSGVDNATYMPYRLRLRWSR